MFLKKLQIINFKNLSDFSLECDDKIICITGKNGTGKTNVLDAINYLCVCKSFLLQTDIQNIQHGQSMFMIQGEIEHLTKVNKISCALKKGQKKQIKVNQKEHEKLIDHVGLFPVVSVTPYDIGLIWESGENRRKWIDGALSQLNHEYLNVLVKYQTTLKQRNAALKAHGFQVSNELIEVFNYQLQQSGEYIYTARQHFCKQITPIFKSIYADLSSGSEDVNLTYASQLHHLKWDELFIKHYQKDLTMQHTTAGIHRDDFLFEINGQPLQKAGSQGQQKSFLLALKLSVLKYFSDRVDKSPLLLLDDIFEKLDQERIRKLLNYISQNFNGQLFLTHTESKQLKEILNDLGLSFKSVELTENIAEYEEER